MSSTYRALTRKYRPQKFEDVVSQEHVSSTLQNAIRQNRLSHAYMFCGPRGVGKTTMARVLARTINQIDESIDGESLSRTLNVIEMDAASNNKVEDIHHLREVVRVPPQSGTYKVFIIDEVHMLTRQAFNALLKTLEEPPPHAIFIFATTEPHKVLPTILSRVQRFDFKRITVEEIVSRLEVICREEGITIDRESIYTIAKRADGALRDALSLMDQAIAFCGLNITYDELIRALNVIGNDELFEYTDVISKRDPHGGLILLDRLLKDGVDIQEFLVALTQHLRNIYVAKNSSRMYLVEATEETKKRYLKASEEFEEADLLRLLHLVSEAQIKIRDVEQPRVHFEILLLKMVHMSRTSELNELLSAVNDLKKNFGNDLKESEKPSASSQRPLSDGLSRSGVQTSSEESGGAGSSMEESREGEQAQGREGVESEKNRGASSVRAATSRSGKVAPEADIAVPPGRNQGLESGGDAPAVGSEVQQNTPPPAERSEATSASAPGSTEGVSRSEGGNRLPGAPPEAEETDDADVMSFITGTPGLGFLKRVEPEEESGPQEGDFSAADASPRSRVRSLDDVEQKWEAVLTQLEKRAPNLLYLQMRDAKLKALKGSELEVAVNNPLAGTIVEENRELVGTICREIYGVYLRLTCVMERQKKAGRALSPFDRFLELQRKDPALKTIVELFGAEIEYR